MPQTFLIFDFGTSEESAQQARHRLEGWRQAFRLGDKLQFKFERKPAEADPQASAAAETGKKPPKKKKAAGSGESAAKEPADRFRVLVRLEFSEHEKLSYQRWLERIPAEALFQGAEKQIVRRGQAGFEEIAEEFEELA